MYALEIRNISKIFRIYPKPVDRLKEILFRRSFHQEFIALEGISFSVPIGQTVGIIGDNGAGKSTLLKILAGTLTPTSGEIIKRGRVAALLELGAGFHPEFTGRQNIYLNAALLGLSQQEIRGREKDIIDFAELREFIDRPVKTYSSGMYVRLAFSIATSVDPDILIVDEALSVGDQRFQKRSLDRILSFQKRQKAIVFCSHNMYHVHHLCKTVIWLDHGRIAAIGSAPEVIQVYEDNGREKQKRLDQDATLVSQESHRGKVRIEAMEVIDDKGRPIHEYCRGQAISIRIAYRGFDSPHSYHFALAILRNDGLTCFASTTQLAGHDPSRLAQGVMVCHVPRLPLLSGAYEIVCAIVDDTGNICYDSKGATILIPKTSEEIGLVEIDHCWENGK